MTHSFLKPIQPPQTTRPARRPRALACTLALVLAACGGGGGGGSTIAKPPSGPKASAPELRIAAPLGALVTTSSVQLVVEYAGDALDLASLSIALDGAPVDGMTVGPALATGMLTELAEGAHELEATIANAQGTVARAVLCFAVELGAPLAGAFANGEGRAELAPAQRAAPLFTFFGDGPLEAFGISVDGAGDIDGDGFGDVLSGARAGDLGAPNAGHVRVHSGRDGGLLLVLAGDVPGESFGLDAASAGDVDGDGRPDVVVGVPADPGAGPQFGSARLFSGADGSLLRVFPGAGQNELYGSAVDGAGDVDGDGRADVIVGAQLAAGNGFATGRADVHSGASGERLLSFEGGETGAKLGISVASAGDVDGDGLADVAVGAWGEDTNGPSAGAALVYSGVDGALLWEFLGDVAKDHQGNALACAGDVDADGVPDLVVGAWEAKVPASNAGLARVYSGDSGVVLLAIHGAGAGFQLGGAVDGAGDVDGDGFADVLIGSPFEPVDGGGLGVVRLCSGRTGEVLRSLVGDNEATRFGLAVANAGDVDGNGVPDAIVGAPFEAHNGPLSGSARVFSGGLLLTTLDGDVLSSARGGSRILALDAGAALGGAPYALIGTASGLDLGPLGLRFDGYARALEVLGHLDARGQARVPVTLPPDTGRGLAGALLHHRFVYADGRLSAPAALRLEP